MFKKTNIKNCEIKNKILMPAMVRHGKAGEDGLVTNKNREHYSLRAKNEVGLIIVEALAVSKEGRVSSTQLGIWDDIFIEGLKSLTEECHKYGAKVFVQLHHGGCKTEAGEKIAPMDFEIKNSKNETIAAARGISKEEIKALEEAYVTAAIRAEKAGFDGIEFQTAHGYLVGQFVSPFLNTRKDEYGGSLENRLRFPAETLTKIKKAVSKDFIVGVRMGGCEPKLEDGLYAAKLYESLGADFLNITAGEKEEKLTSPQNEYEYKTMTQAAIQIKKVVKIPVFAVGELHSREKIDYLLDNELVDMVCVGRALLADPQWARKIKEKEEVQKCLHCKPCRWFSKNGICPQNREKM